MTSSSPQTDPTQAKRVLLLGSTGSIGASSLRIVADHPGRFRIVGIAAHRSVDALERQARSLRPRYCVATDPEAALELRRRLAGLEVVVLGGEEGLLQMIAEADFDVAMHGISGAAGLKASLAVLDRGLPLALANKESLVIAGELMMRRSRERNAPILPVDSEHSALFQCMEGHGRQAYRRLILTGSGGPFRDRALETFGTVTREEALAHPNWDMGARITIGSATMMNKALEVIEAHHLFGAPADRILVVIHRQSVVHSMVEFEDGSVIAQMGPPDMKVPIHFALTYPDRAPTNYPGFDPRVFSTLTFEAPDPRRFPSLELGFEAVRRGGLHGVVLNAADEVAVARFLAGEISFRDIHRTNERVFASTPHVEHPTLEQLLDADAWAREEATRCLASSIP